VHVDMVVALVIGIWLTIRKLDVRRREPQDYPNVDRDAFLRWKQTELGAYQLGSVACFLKIFADLVILMLLPVGFRVAGLGVFLLWVAALILARVRAGAGRRMRDELGIDLRVAGGRSGDAGT
jgi:hypothetical protein